MKLSDVTVIMPLAGQATRARMVTGDVIPKSLIRLGNGQTVLEAMCRQLQSVGFRRFVFCVGHLKQLLIKKITEESWITDCTTTYIFDETEHLLGPTGTVLHAIESLSLSGQALAIPGDVMLPWKNLPIMTRRHISSYADITFGVTSFVTDRTCEIGKIVVENQTHRLLYVYGRNDIMPLPNDRTRYLTSAAANVLSVSAFSVLCENYFRENPHYSVQPLCLRDDILPWAIKAGRYEIQTFDLEGETLDLGTPETIKYAQANWQQYLPAL